MGKTAEKNFASWDQEENGMQSNIQRRRALGGFPAISWSDGIFRIGGTTIGSTAIGAAIGSAGGPAGSLIGAAVGAASGVALSTYDIMRRRTAE